MLLTVKTILKLSVKLSDKLETEIYRTSRHRSRSPDNAKFGHFTLLLFCKEREESLQRFITHLHDCSTHESFCLVTFPLYSRCVFVKLSNVNVFLFHKAVGKRHNTTLKHSQVLFYGKPNQIPDYYEIARLAPINICHADCVKLISEEDGKRCCLPNPKPLNSLL